MSLLAWHFVADTLRDGRPVPPNGEWLEHEGTLELCASGLHASVDPFDALQYAPGDTLCRVELDGEIVHGEDKVVARRRRIVARIDATDLCRAFARQCALDVFHLWKAPQIVRDYLTTGDASLRAAAGAAAWAAARDAAMDAAWAAARDAAMAAAWAAARDAARAAAGAAAWDAARAAAGAAARDAAMDAAWAAARTAARAAQCVTFTRMVTDAFREVPSCNQ